MHFSLQNQCRRWMWILPSFLPSLLFSAVPDLLSSALTADSSAYIERLKAFEITVTRSVREKISTRRDVPERLLYRDETRAQTSISRVVFESPNRFLTQVSSPLGSPNFYFIRFDDDAMIRQGDGAVLKSELRRHSPEKLLDSRIRDTQSFTLRYLDALKVTPLGSRSIAGRSAHGFSISGANRAITVEPYLEPTRNETFFPKKETVAEAAGEIWVDAETGLLLSEKTKWKTVIELESLVVESDITLERETRNVGAAKLTKKLLEQYPEGESDKP